MGCAAVARGAGAVVAFGALGLGDELELPELLREHDESDEPEEELDEPEDEPDEPEEELDEREAL